MLFNSPEFLFAFLPIFLGIYFFAAAKFRNGIIFAASVFFYFTTSGELTTILILSIVINYGFSLGIAKVKGFARKLFLATSILVNLVPLLYYKYAKFFVAVWNDAANSIGIHLHIPSPDPILPIGISFFTFQAVSYVADIYMNRVKPARSLIDFGMYHSCFPQLIAGPIVRYEEVEAQVHSRTYHLDDMYNGIVQFCFGFGKKAILADNIGVVADKMFGLEPNALSFASAWIGIIAYTLQIYFDFSGYSDMAIGLGRLLGFSYPENFNQPYRSLSVTEFWRRWHMTLARWFRDYVYIPLGGNRRGTIRTLVNLVIVFFLCGLWHGAAYTFVIWGLYHGTLLIAERLGKQVYPITVPAPLGWIYTMLAIMIGWVFFRAQSLEAAFSYIRAMFSIKGAGLHAGIIGATLPSDKIAYILLGMTVAFVPYARYVHWEGKRYFFSPVWAVASLVVFIIGIAMMSVNGFSPFIYFRF